MNFFSQYIRQLPILREGTAERVIFHYPGEDSTFLDVPHVTLYKNGTVDIKHKSENISTHIQNLEIIWKRKNLPTEVKPLILYRFDKEEHA